MSVLSSAAGTVANVIKGNKNQAMLIVEDWRNVDRAASSSGRCGRGCRGSHELRFACLHAERAVSGHAGLHCRKRAGSPPGGCHGRGGAHRRLFPPVKRYLKCSSTPAASRLTPMSIM